MLGAVEVVGPSYDRQLAAGCFKALSCPFLPFFAGFVAKCSTRRRVQRCHFDPTSASESLEASRRATRDAGAAEIRGSRTEPHRHRQNQQLARRLKKGESSNAQVVNNNWRLTKEPTHRLLEIPRHMKTHRLTTVLISATSYQRFSCGI